RFPLNLKPDLLEPYHGPILSTLLANDKVGLFSYNSLGCEIGPPLLIFILKNQKWGITICHTKKLLAASLYYACIYQQRKRRKSCKRFSVTQKKRGITRRLPDGKVANGNWNGGQAKFNWDYRGNCNPNYGARSEISRKGVITTSFAFDRLSSR
ncbi:MAG: hypothetical protein Greene041679_350, partial [Parcubacteria group bacterium Greene0416_79]